MKRSIKNIICVVLILLITASMYFTMSYSSNGSGNSNQELNKEMMNMPGNDGKASDMGTPPEKPSGDMSKGSTTDSSNSESGTKTNMSEPPAKPEGNSGDMPSFEDSEGMQKGPNENTKNQSLDSTYYIAFGLESILLSLVLVYFIMSQFNKKDFKETLNNRLSLEILISIILAAILMYGCVCMTNKYFLKGNVGIPNGEKMDNQNSNITYSSEKEITENNTTITDGSFSSTKEDQNAVLISGATDVQLSNTTLDKSGDSDGGDSTSFYGTNSALIAKDGATVTLKNVTVNTNATGANGIFCYGGSATTNNSSSDGTTVIISDSKITTSKDNSGGIMTTGGGIMKAYNLDITTAGVSSAAIRTDRGGGSVEVDGGTYTTTGKGSPAIYSTADIDVKNATLTSSTSEGIVIEGKNSVSITNCKLIDTNNELNGKSTTYKNIFLYQSMSGDADDGTSKFSADSSNITTNNGDTFYITNTSAEIELKNNVIVNNDLSGNFLRAQSDSWGKTGENGGKVKLTLTNQKVTGNISVDSVSTLTMNMKENSKYEGTINSENSTKELKLILDSTSGITLTGDSYVTSLENSLSDNSNINFNGYKLYVNGTAIN